MNLTLAQLEALAERVPTPFYVYDERGIRDAAQALNAAFGWAPGFCNYFAVKALPNPFILKILRAAGLGADCSSLPELLLAERAGFSGNHIMFTANNTPAEEFAAARSLGAVINLDDLGHLDYLARHVGLPELLSFRYNPGPLRSGNAIIGEPQQAKFGVTRDQLFEGYAAARAAGVQRFGLHTMLASNELDADALVQTAHMLFALAVELSQELDIRFEFINLGGGIGIPYHPEQRPVDLADYGERVQQAAVATFGAANMPLPRLALECGRVISGPSGWLVSRVRHIKRTYKTYVGLDATMANLMRPGMYGAYHHISVPARADMPHDVICDVTGSLCENNDKFAIDRALPAVTPGDLVLIHDAGAHGHAMGFNYNGKLRCAELLHRSDGSIIPIRRAETVEDYFATLDLGAADAFVV